MIDCKKGHGVTLVEVMVVIAIFTIIGGVLMRILLVGGTSWRVGEAQAEVIKEARKGMSWMARELQHTRSSQITGALADGSPYNLIIFRLPIDDEDDLADDDDVIDVSGYVEWSDQIQYSRGGTNNRQLLRTEGDVSTPIVNDVTTLTFRRLASTPDIVEITIGTQKTTIEGTVVPTNGPFTLSNKIKLRN
ncbi:MAG: hypothetical protein AMJ78_09360 [Omnitrophica WOR_2 bacterium SM23_29]|nr:MAG: hypothetical protein AMJ78_09360 [Omnitrophica WOR_2 bacterium SM23_29]